MTTNPWNDAEASSIYPLPSQLEEPFEEILMTNITNLNKKNLKLNNAKKGAWAKVVKMTQSLSPFYRKF